MPEVHVLMVCLNYSGEGYLNVSATDGVRFARLCSLAKVSSITCMYDNGDLPEGAENGGEPTIQNVDEAIRRIGSKVPQNGVFVVFFAGHGTQVEDEDGDEKDGLDEAWCLVGGDMIDDQISDSITQSVPVGARVLIISDCCHSGTIGDVDSSKWANHKAILFAGAQEFQCSIETGKGGNLTSLMCESIETFSEKKMPKWSAQRLWKEMSGMVSKGAYAEQTGKGKDKTTMNFKYSSCTSPERFLWPLVPGSSYQENILDDEDGGKLPEFDDDGFEPAGKEGADGGADDYGEDEKFDENGQDDYTGDDAGDDYYQD